MKKTFFYAGCIAIIVFAGVTAFNFVSARNSNLWQYYDSLGQKLPSVKQRAQLAEEVCGIADYYGTAKQNEQLLDCMLNGQVIRRENDGMLGLMIDKLSKTIRTDISNGTNDNTIDTDPLVTLQGHRLTQSDVGDKMFFKVGSGDNVTWGYCTGMTDNTTYYSLTGCELGLYDYGTSMATSSANIQAHSAGEPFMITNQHHWYIYYFPDKTSDQTITSLWTFNQYPVMSIATMPTSSLQFATKGYADAMAMQGGATSTESVTGIVQLGTQIEMASSSWDALVPTVLQTKYSTSSPYGAGLWIPITQNNGKLSQSFLDLTQNFMFTGASNTFSGILRTDGGLYASGTVQFGTSGQAATNTVYNNLDIDGNLEVATITPPSTTTTITKDLKVTNLDVTGTMTYGTDGSGVAFVYLGTASRSNQTTYLCNSVTAGTKAISIYATQNGCTVCGQNLIILPSGAGYNATTTQYIDDTAGVGIDFRWNISAGQICAFPAGAADWNYYFYK